MSDHSSDPANGRDPSFVPPRPVTSRTFPSFSVRGPGSYPRAWRRICGIQGDDRPTPRDRFLAGALLPASRLIQAQRVRAACRPSAMRLFEDVDVILAPATPFVAPPIGQAVTEIDGQILPIRSNLGVYTQPPSCIGLPVIAVPLSDPGGADTPQGLPIGVQLIAAPRREDALFRVAAALERAGVVAAPAPPA